MINQLWINLPVKDVAKAREFFVKIGFTLNPQYGNGPGSASLLVGTKSTCVMLFPEATFQSFVMNEVADPRRATEVLFSIGADSRAEVDEMAQKVAAAGGTVFAEPSAKGDWMYGCGFIDPDGHRWNMLYMDMSKIPKG
ncbi:MAG: VOC family protein [Planctomycetia bacterium]|nr:VOC family protein [Planctomycetia bacterium]